MSFKIAEYRKAQLALAKQVALFEELKTDPELRKELEFSAELDELLEKHGMTRNKLQAFLAVQGKETDDLPKAPKAKTAKPAKAKTGEKRPYNRKVPPTPVAGRTFTNPNTNETIVVKRKDHGVLQKWIAEHGNDVVMSWQQVA